MNDHRCTQSITSRIFSKIKRLGKALSEWAESKMPMREHFDATPPAINTEQRKATGSVNQGVIIEGRWWIFGTDKDPHFGLLEYDPEESTTLTVKIPQHGSIESILQLFEDRGDSVPSTIWGVDKNNQPISLFGCRVINSSANVGQQDFTINIMVVVCGLHSSSWDEVALDRIAAEFSLLHNWLGTSRISVSHGQETTIKVAERKVTEYDLDGGVKLKFWPTQQMVHNSEGLSISEGHGIEFRFNEVRKVKETLHTYVEGFRRFLSLTVGRPVFIDKINAFITQDSHPLEVKILLRNPGVREAHRKLLHPQMRASYKEMQGTFEEVIRRWYQLESTIDDVLNLYFATIFNRSLYMHQQFLFLAQALEVYHRTSPNYENMVQPRAEFRARRKRIVDAVPDEKEWLSEKLSHANEKTLAQRLEELLNTHATDVSQFIQDVKAFADSVRHTRNHFTHYGTSEEQMDKVARGTDLIRLTYQMEALVEICILKDLGILGAPISRIISSVNGHSYFSI